MREEVWYCKRNVAHVGERLLPFLWSALNIVLNEQDIQKLSREFGLTTAGKDVLFEGPYTLAKAVSCAEAIKKEQK